jgi:hypothetical protein
MKKVPVQQLKGVTLELKAKMKEHQIEDHAQLFEAALTPQKREELAAKLGISHKLTLELANRADLARLQGVAGVYSDLLEEAGVDTVKELRERNAEHLHAKLEEINKAKHLTQDVPSPKVVDHWISLAKRRRKFLQY